VTIAQDLPRGTCGHLQQSPLGQTPNPAAVVTIPSGVLALGRLRASVLGDRPAEPALARRTWLAWAVSRARRGLLVAVVGWPCWFLDRCGRCVRGSQPKLVLVAELRARVTQERDPA